MDQRLPVVAVAAAAVVVLAAGWWWLPHPLLGAVLGLLPLAAWVVLRFPVWVGLLFVLFSFFRLHEVFPPLYPLRIPLLLAAAAFATVLWQAAVARTIRPYGSRELAAFGLFFTLVTLSVVFAGNRAEALGYWSATYVKIGLMVPVLAWLLRGPREFALALRLVTAAGLAVGAVALFNKSAGIGLVEGSRVTIGRELGSVLGDPNDLALVLLFPFSFAGALLLGPRLPRGDRLLGALGVAALAAAVVATQSRGGLLGMVAVAGVFAWRRVRSKALLVGGGGLLTGLLYLAAGIGGRKSGGAAEEGIDESAMGRIHAWDAAFGMALDHPLTGVGLNNFYFNYYFYSDYWDGLNHAVHSTWFGVLGETGFLGLAAFIAMVAAVGRSAARSLRAVEGSPGAVPALPAIAEGNLAGLAGFCVSGTFLTQGFTWPLYILLAFTVAVAHHVAHREVTP